jgi:hypothetical protein
MDMTRETADFLTVLGYRTLFDLSSVVVSSH